MQKTPTKSFERFYYERVGIGEGCGCAELIIGVQDHDTRAAAIAGTRTPGKVFQWLGRLLKITART